FLYPIKRIFARYWLPHLGHDLDTIQNSACIVAPSDFAAGGEGGNQPMFALARVGLAAALLTIASVFAAAADKPFERDDLSQAAIKLEAQIKSDAGDVTKSVVQLRRDADAAFQKNDFRSGMMLLSQIAATTPDDSANWLRLARSIQQMRAANDRERTLLLER